MISCDIQPKAKSIGVCIFPSSTKTIRIGTTNGGNELQEDIQIEGGKLHDFNWFKTLSFSEVKYIYITGVSFDDGDDATFSVT